MYDLGDYNTIRKHLNINWEKELQSSLTLGFTVEQWAQASNQ